MKRSGESAAPSLVLSSKRRKRFNADSDDDDDPYVDVVPPLRSSSNLWAGAVVGPDDSRPSDRLKVFADVLFWIKINPMEENFKEVALSALNSENLSWRMDMNLKSSGKFVFDLFVDDDVLVSRGEGFSSEDAETEAFEDFCERALTSDFIALETRFGAKSAKLKLFEDDNEVRENPATTAFRYDILCKDHRLRSSHLPTCALCRNQGHNKYFCRSLIPPANETSSSLGYVVEPVPASRCGVNSPSTSGVSSVSETPNRKEASHSAIASCLDAWDSSISKREACVSPAQPFGSAQYHSCSQMKIEVDTVHSKIKSDPELDLDDSLVAFIPGNYATFPPDIPTTALEFFRPPSALEQDEVRAVFQAVASLLFEGHVDTSDALAMLEEFLWISRATPADLISFFQTRNFEVARVFSYRYGLPILGFLRSDTDPPELDRPCAPDELHRLISLRDTVFLKDDATLEILWSALESANKMGVPVAVDFHISHLHAKPVIDLLTIATGTTFFHLLCFASFSNVNYDAIEMIKRLVYKPLVSVNPSILQRYLFNQFSCETQFFDLGRFIENQAFAVDPNDPYSVYDAMTSFLCSSSRTFCRRAKSFSASVMPSWRSVRHWELRIALALKYTEFVGEAALAPYRSCPRLEETTTVWVPTPGAAVPSSVPSKIPPTDTIKLPKSPEKTRRFFAKKLRLRLEKSPELLDDEDAFKIFLAESGPSWLKWDGKDVKSTAKIIALQPPAIKVQNRIMTFLESIPIFHRFRVICRFLVHIDEVFKRNLLRRILETKMIVPSFLQLFSIFQVFDFDGRFLFELVISKWDQKKEKWRNEFVEKLEMKTVETAVKTLLDFVTNFDSLINNFAKLDCFPFGFLYSLCCSNKDSTLIDLSPTVMTRLCDFPEESNSHLPFKNKAIPIVIGSGDESYFQSLGKKSKKANFYHETWRQEATSRGWTNYEFSLFLKKYLGVDYESKEKELNRFLQILLATTVQHRAIKILHLIHLIKKVPVPTNISELEENIFFRYCDAALFGGFADPDDLFAIVEEGRRRLNRSPRFAVEFFKDKNVFLTNLLCETHSITPPEMATRTPLHSGHCDSLNGSIQSVIDNLIRVVVITGHPDCLVTMTKSLRSATRIAIVHVPALSIMPSSDLPFFGPDPETQMYSLRTENHVFHLSCFDPIFQEARTIVDACLKDKMVFLAKDKTVRIFHNMTDKNICLLPMVLDRQNMTSAQMAHEAVGDKKAVSHRASLFSCHKTPSVSALRHTEIRASLAFLLGRKYELNSNVFKTSQKRLQSFLSNLVDESESGQDH